MDLDSKRIGDESPFSVPDDRGLGLGESRDDSIGVVKPAERNWYSRLNYRCRVNK